MNQTSSGKDDADEDEILRSKRAVVFVDNDGRDVGTSGSGGSGSGSGGSATVVGSSNEAGTEPLDQELDSSEVRDWATRVDSRGNRLYEPSEPSQS